MVVDSSALMAIFFEEPDASFYVSAITSDAKRMISVATLVEASIVAMMRRRPDPIAALDILMTRLHIEVVPVDEEQGSACARRIPALWQRARGGRAQLR
ncbi:MAG: type II toxin-antitoxin system VapC family toxin [Acidobacteriaceae bacterium]|jgi:ribonuclease VapC